MRKQIGFAFLELVLVVVVVAAVGFTAVTAYNHHKAAEQPAVSTDTSQPAVASVGAAPQVTSAPDLNAAETALDQTDVDASSSDSSQLSSQSSGF
jgi:cytoskeletal protein RodZ